MQQKSPHIVYADFHFIMRDELLAQFLFQVFVDRF